MENQDFEAQPACEETTCKEDLMNGFLHLFALAEEEEAKDADPDD